MRKAGREGGGRRRRRERERERERERGRSERRKVVKKRRRVEGDRFIYFVSPPPQLWCSVTCQGMPLGV